MHHLLHHLLVVLGVLLGSLEPWYLCQGKFAAILHLNLPLGVTNEGPEAIKLISSVVAGDSSLQDRAVAHYLLSLLFSLVSLPF